MKGLLLICAGVGTVLVIVLVLVVSAVSIPVTGTASERLSRISQLDRGQYSSAAEWRTWSPSTCSTTSMTEVMNAYGTALSITNVLKVEAGGLHEISPALGMLHPEAIGKTVGQFGFADLHHDYTPDDPRALDQLIALGNAGYPVIAGFPPSRWAGGHLLVLLGGDAASVHLADSSRLNLQHISRGQFLHWWGGSADLVTPASQAPSSAALPAHAFAASPYVQVAWNMARAYYLPSPQRFVAQINQESHFDPKAVGPLVYVGGQPTHAVGIAQFLPSTARCIDRDPKTRSCYSIDPTDPQQALAAAAYLMEKSWLAYLQQRPGDSTGAYQKALAAYNAGAGAVEAASSRCGGRWLSCLPPETQHYVTVIMAAA